MKRNELLALLAFVGVALAWWNAQKQQNANAAILRAIGAVQPPSTVNNPIPVATFTPPFQTPITPGGFDSNGNWVPDDGGTGVTDGSNGGSTVNDDGDFINWSMMAI